MNKEMKDVLITGAGGSIGSEFAAQIILSPKLKKVYINDIAESSLFSTVQKIDALQQNC